MKSIAVIIVAYNSRDAIERTLQSVVDSTIAGEMETVVVDNASSDGTAEFVRERFPQCRVIEPGENLGFGRACNLAAGETESEFLLLLNPDAWVEPSCVERLRAAMVADQRLAWASPRLFYPDGRRQFNWSPTVGMFGEAVQRLRNRFESRAWVQGPVPRVLRALGDRGWFTAACGLVRRRAWDAVGGFDPGFFLYFEDADLGVRLREVRWVSKEIAAARAIHDRRRPRASSDAAVRYRQSQLRYYRKHRPPWESRLLLRKLRRDAARIEDVATRVRLRQVCEESEPRS